MSGGVGSAIKWISERLAENPEADKLSLLDEASQRFDLSPLQAEFVLGQFSKKK